MKKKPKVAIIILNYNGLETIKNCLESVFRSDYKNYEVIVVDNLSEDGSLELAKKFFSRAHFLLNGNNLGFAAGNNIAIRFALEKMADYVFLLNNDAIIKENTLSRLIETSEKDRRIGIVNPVIKAIDGSVWFAGGKIKWFSMKACHLRKIKKMSPYKTKYATGCAMLIKRNVFQEVGLFDENFFLYYEDVDFCLRARKKGFKILVDPSAEIKHFEKSQDDLSKKTYWLVLSGVLFFKKSAHWLLKPWLFLYFRIRKIKNWMDTRNRSSSVKLAVRQAYEDYEKLKK